MLFLCLKFSMDSYLIRVNAKVLTRFYMALHYLALATYLSTSSSPYLLYTATIMFLQDEPGHAVPLLKILNGFLSHQSKCQSPYKVLHGPTLFGPGYLPFHLLLSILLTVVPPQAFWLFLRHPHTLLLQTFALAVPSALSTSSG